MQTAQKDADRGEEESCLGAGDGGLEVLGKPAAAIEQGERSLNDPASRQQDKPLGRVRSFDDLYVPAAVVSERLFQFRPGIAAICKDVAHPRQQRTDRCQQRRRAVTVLDIGGMHLGGYQVRLTVGPKDRRIGKLIGPADCDFEVKC